MHGTATTTTADVGTPEDLAYSVPRAAALLDLSERQVWYLVNRKEIKSVKIGNSRRIPRDVLVAYLDKLLRSAA